MSAEPPCPPARDGHADHPLAKAWATWQAWSTADAWRTAAEQAIAVGEPDAQVEPLANCALGGPDPLVALRANHTVVLGRISQQWQAVRDARQRGRGWHEIGRALGLAPAEARDAYARTVVHQRRCAAGNPDLARGAPLPAALGGACPRQRRRPRLPAPRPAGARAERPPQGGRS